MTTPAATALIDQAHAAAEHGASIFAATAQRIDAAVSLTAPTGARAAILTRLYRLAATGQVTTCPHLHRSRPEPQFWAAWQPRLVHCVQCLGRATQDIKGTAEDQRCDHCHRVVDTIWSCEMFLPAFVLPDLLIGRGPTLMTFGLCRPCLDSSTSGDQPVRPRRVDALKAAIEEPKEETPCT